MNKIGQAEQNYFDVMRFTLFSHHATKRVIQRTQLTCLELASVLDHRLFVHVGNEPGLPREHLLFYSLPDDDLFVAVRDKMTGVVVTVLPLDYHANLAWSISPIQMKKAKELSCNVARDTAADAVEKSQSSSSAVPKAPRLLVVSCTYMEPSGRTTIKTLLKVPAIDYQYEIRTFIHDEGTPALIDNASLRKELDPTRVISVAVRLGKKGISEVLVLKDPVWMH